MELILKATSGNLDKLQVSKLMGSTITKGWFPPEWMLKISAEGNSISKISNMKRSIIKKQPQESQKRKLRVVKQLSQRVKNFSVNIKAPVHSK